jgi:hypothetical protein
MTNEQDPVVRLKAKILAKEYQIMERRGLPIAPPEIQLTAADDKFLAALKVAWEPEAVPGFILPYNLTEFLNMYPNKIREATAMVAKEFGYEPLNDSLDDWTQEIIANFLMFREEKFEDIIEMYITAPPRMPGQSVSSHFMGYVEMRVRALFPVVIGD